MDEGNILVYCCPSTFSLASPTLPHLPKINVQYLQTVCVCGGWGGVLNCAVDHILQWVLRSVSDQIRNRREIIVRGQSYFSRLPKY
jgi:hypothetical protein